MTIDSTAFRDALGRFATGVAVVTGLSPEGTPQGVTVSAFSSLSLDPPLVLFCLGKETASRAAFVEGAHFAVNVLSEAQEDLSNLFARRNADKFGATEYTTGLGGCPVLAGAIAVIECRREAVLDGGDHDIVIGRVERLATAEGAPLLYFQGRYGRLA